MMWLLRVLFLDTPGHPTSALQYSNSNKYTTYAQNNQKFGHRRQISMDSHPYSYETSIFTLGVPHKEVQGRQTKVLP